MHWYHYHSYWYITIHDFFGGIPTPLKNMSSSAGKDYSIPYISIYYGKIKNVPNHQPATVNWHRCGESSDTSLPVISPVISPYYHNELRIRSSESAAPLRGEDLAVLPRAGRLPVTPGQPTWWKRVVLPCQNGEEMVASASIWGSIMVILQCYNC